MSGAFVKSSPRPPLVLTCNGEEDLVKAYRMQQKRIPKKIGKYSS